MQMCTRECLWLVEYLTSVELIKVEHTRPIYMASESRNPAKHTYIYAIMSVCREPLRNYTNFELQRGKSATVIWPRDRDEIEIAERANTLEPYVRTLDLELDWRSGMGMTAETMPDDDLPRSRCRSRSSQGASEQFIFIHICIYLTRRCG